MKVHEYRILIFTENPDTLVKFYKQALGFRELLAMDIPGDRGYLLEVNHNEKLWIGYHSKVHGYNPEPDRHIFNLHVDSMTDGYNLVKDYPGIKIVSQPQETPLSKPNKPDYVSTFLDPEGNCWQFRGGL